jgi:hypothetical protein
VPIGAQEKAVDCGECSPYVDTVDRPTAPLASEACEGKGSAFLRRITVFAGHENAIRLLGYLGYRWSR